jgi:hypothetical protein
VCRQAVTILPFLLNQTYSKRDTSEEQDKVEKERPQDKRKWINHVSRVEDIRYPKQILDYRPIDRKTPVRPLKGLLEGYNREAETGHLLGQLCDQNKKKKDNT